MTFKLFLLHTDFCSIFFFLCYLAICPWFFPSFFSSFCFALCLCPYPSTMPKKTRANSTLSLSSESPFRSELFRNDWCREVFEKLNCKRKIWAKRSVVLDDVDPAIRANFESRGWLSILEVDHPPPTALIWEFFSNLSCHVYDSNTLVRSWIRGVEFTITPRVVADTLGVPVIREPVYPYKECPPLDESLGLLSSRVLILRSCSLSLLRLPIFSLG